MKKHLYTWFVGLVIVLATFALCTYVFVSGAARERAVRGEHDWRLVDDDFLRRSTKAQMLMLAASVRVYYRLYGKYPEAGIDLRQSFNEGGVSCGGEGQSMISTDDGWGEQIKYSVSNSAALLISAGVDRSFNTTDDLVRVIQTANGSNTVWKLPEELEWARTMRAIESRNKDKKWNELKKKISHWF